jgi:photosystem II stability/assembly factor-like uncharacterized protein
VFRSVDGGKNWEKTSKGLGSNLFAWQLRMNTNNRIFVLFTRGKIKERTVAGAIYFSDDKAATWSPLKLPDSVNAPHDLLIDPRDPEKMYVSCWPATFEHEDRFGGVFKTLDGGQSWTQIFDERVRVNSAAIDPVNSGTLYVNTFQNAAYRSDDAGKNWKRIEGYRFKWGQRAIPDIHHPGMLFLTTFGGSVFYGPASGIPGADTDIVNMPENWW